MVAEVLLDEGHDHLGEELHLSARLLEVVSPVNDVVKRFCVGVCHPPNGLAGSLSLINLFGTV